MKEILNKMFEHQNLTRGEAREVLLNTAAGRYNDAQLSAFMTVFLMRAITLDELAGFRDALLELRTPLDLGCPDAIDIVGTGGDGKNTFNISTATCFVVAATGIPVVKHGNYGASSVSGASNVLEEHGVKFTADSGRLRRSLEESGVAYLHAPFFSPALKTVAPVRKALGVRNFFNMLGPMVNPTMPRYQLLGVYNLKLLRLYRYITEREGIDCTVIHSLDGYDEISLTAPFKVASKEREAVLTPADLGMEKAQPEELSGGETVKEAAKIFDNVLEGRGSEAQRNCVVANAAFAILTVRPELTLDDALGMAREALESGRASEVFRKFVTLNS